MDLPDCPPGAEGYEDSVVEVQKKSDDPTCTKAEQEFQDHLNSLKIRLEDDSTRPMVERRGRDISGKWIYLCFPCAAMCSGESVLQTHISGKKHKTKLQMKNVWPLSIFENHPYIQNEKGNTTKGGASESTLRKMAVEVDLHNKNPNELDSKYGKFRNVECHIQESLDKVKAPLIGLEYLIEHPPQQSHYEPSYMCTLCQKQGHPRTIINHLTCFWHRYNYICRHYPKASALLSPYKNQNQYREGVLLIMNRVAQRIEDKFGRRRPLYIDKDDYDKEKEAIQQWVFKCYHFSELDGPTFEEVVDVDLIISLSKNSERGKKPETKDPSPPRVTAPQKPLFNSYTRPAGRNERRAPSIEDISDVSGDERPPPHRRVSPRAQRSRSPTTKYRERREARDHIFGSKPARYEPYKPRPQADVFKTRYALKNSGYKDNKDEKLKPPNYEYKMKLAADKTAAAVESAKKTLAYHEKNPEKHPLYPDEWKKFWNRRYKEIQAEGKDPSKHDFKPEWIVYWTGRMKELHDEELRVVVNEAYRKLCLTPPPLDTRREPDRRRPDYRKRSPEARRRSGSPRRPSPHRRGPPGPPGRRSPERRFAPEPRRREPPPRTLRTRSRSPINNAREGYRRGSPARANIQLESLRRSESPLSRREHAMRNRSPAPLAAPHTVTISDDELKPDGLSPWNSEDDIASLGSLPDARSPVLRPRSRSRAGSSASRRSRSQHSTRYGRTHQPQGQSSADYGAPDNVVATLRLLVALEDYLGSLGPKIVDLLTEALKMEKEKANSSEELLDSENSVALMETAKEKLKGAVQAGLVSSAATQPVRSAVVRVASLLHEADRRASAKKKEKTITARTGVPVAGVGQVDRAQIAQQMAAALVAQGKTDVSSEELAQLVDAVVGMAEAKKREAAAVSAQPKPVTSRPPTTPVKVVKPSAPTTSALQMLQSAYDEYDKKVDKDEAPDAMDGLSDSDLETLLKNFNELSAEEQHSLIAYLKKLEAKEPRRVERLREYVSAAAATAPPAEPDAPPPPPPPQQDDAPPAKVVAIESDDDDYTVEEVFNTAKQKVKEDQIRQEMEIVTKSLQEAKPPTPTEPIPSNALPGLDIINSTSAANLLAMVQASIAQTIPAPTQQVNPAPEVVASSTQPRSFGDLPEAPMEPSKPLSDALPHNPAPTSFNQGFTPNIQHNFEGNMNDMMANPPPSNENLRNMPMNSLNDNIRNIPFNQPYDGNNMGMNNINIPMDDGGNMGMYNRSMPLNDPGNMGMNNRPVMSMHDNNNMRNMPIYDNDIRQLPMNDSDVRHNMPNNDDMRNMPPMNENFNQGGRVNQWENRQPMQNMGGPPMRGNFSQFNQGTRGGFMNGGSGIQQDRFNNNSNQNQYGNNQNPYGNNQNQYGNNQNQYGNNQGGGGGGRGGRGRNRGRGRGSFY